jgi:hypothetical protein
MPACPGATGYAHATVFTAYECLTFHCRILTCQVWARGLGQGHKGTNSNCKFSIVNFQLLVAWWLPEELLNNITIDFNKIIDMNLAACGGTFLTGLTGLTRFSLYPEHPVYPV